MRIGGMLAFFLSVLGAPAAATWHEASTTHFLIYSEGNVANLTSFATRLEKFDQGMRILRGLKDFDPGKANRVTIYVVDGLSDVARLYGKGGSNVGGFYQGRAGGSLAIIPRRSGSGDRFDTDSESILLHEYSHHFLFAHYAGAYPRWFIEGFAEFHSTAAFEKDGSIGFGLPALPRLYSLLALPQMPIERLLDPGERQFTAEQNAVFYARGWLLTHYLSFEPTRKGQLGSYLTAINSGKTNLDAARQAFGDLKILNGEMDRYVRRPRLSYLSMASAAVKIGPIAVRTLGPAEQALMDVRIRSKRGVDDKGAAAVLPLAQKRAAPFPNDAFAQVVLAEAEFDAGHLEAAEAAAARAVASDPKSIDGMLYRAMVLHRRAATAETAEGVTWDAVRRAYVAANRIDPDDPKPLIGFYTTFLAQGRKPTPNSVIGLVRAFELAPQDIELRYMIVRQYLIDDKVKDARLALIPLAYDPHPSPSSQAALKLMGLIDAGKTDEALVAVNASPIADADETR